jgi:hypothetical protein
MLNGGSVAATPQFIRFYTNAGGGLFTLFFGPETGFSNGQPIPEFTFSGNQVFSGTTASPIILTGSYPVSDALYSDAPNYDDEGASGTVVVSAQQTTVPEPSETMVILVVLTLLLPTAVRRGK